MSEYGVGSRRREPSDLFIIAVFLEHFLKIPQSTFANADYFCLDSFFLSVAQLWVWEHSSLGTRAYVLSLRKSGREPQRTHCTPLPAKTRKACLNSSLGQWVKLWAGNRALQMCVLEWRANLYTSQKFWVQSLILTSIKRKPPWTSFSLPQIRRCGQWIWQDIFQLDTPSIIDISFLGLWTWKNT